MSLLVEIITPESKVFSGTASSVRVSGSKGEFGVLPSHMNMISSLKTGNVVIVSEDEKETRRFIISDGFADVGHSKCVILVERALDAEKINTQDISDKIAKLKSPTSSERPLSSIEKEIEFLELALK